MSSRRILVPKSAADLPKLPKLLLVSTFAGGAKHAMKAPANVLAATLTGVLSEFDLLLEELEDDE